MTDLPVRANGDVSLLVVRVTPKSSRDALEGVEADAAGQTYLKVKVKAVPEKGAANKAVCRVLSKTLELPKSAVSVRSGDTSRLKQIEIALPVEDLKKKLSEVLGKHENLH